MIPGILLTAAEHCFATTEEPCPPKGDAPWVLIDCSPCTEQDAQDYERIYTCTYYHWAARKDGMSLMCSHLDQTISAQAATIESLREQLATTKAQLELVRKGAHSK